jgi:hypothetical protein
MRKLIVTDVVLIITSLTAFLLSPHAQAMTTRVSSAAMIHRASPIEDVAYRCQKVRRCDYRGCGWQRDCQRQPPRYRPYGWNYPYDWQSYHFVWQ